VWTYDTAYYTHCKATWPIPWSQRERSFELFYERDPDRFLAMLRQYHIDELTIDELGRLYQVNRATAARWVIAARTTLLDATRTRLAAPVAILVQPGDVEARCHGRRVELLILRREGVDDGRDHLDLGGVDTVPHERSAREYVGVGGLDVGAQEVPSATRERAGNVNPHVASPDDRNVQTRLQR